MERRMYGNNYYLDYFTSFVMTTFVIAKGFSPVAIYPFLYFYTSKLLFLKFSQSENFYPNNSTALLPRVT